MNVKRMSLKSKRAYLRLCPEKNDEQRIKDKMVK